MFRRRIPKPDHRRDPQAIQPKNRRSTTDEPGCTRMTGTYDHERFHLPSEGRSAEKAPFFVLFAFPRSHPRIGHSRGRLRERHAKRARGPRAFPNRGRLVRFAQRLIPACRSICVHPRSSAVVKLNAVTRIARITTNSNSQLRASNFRLLRSVHCYPSKSCIFARIFDVVVTRPVE